MELANLIYARRKEKGLSQEQLAEAVGVARQTVSKWETAETVPDVESLRKLALVLEFSVDKVLGISERGPRDGETGETGEADDDYDDDDSFAWLMTGGFVIGTALGIALENYILGIACAMAGFGLGIIIKALRKKD